jgi:inner membrane protein
MDTLIPATGAWFWFILAALLLFGELMVPGIFLMWLGVAAILTGFADILFGFDWRLEIVSFALLSLALVAATWRWVTPQWVPKSDQPHLNQRHQSYVGRSYVLDHAIVDGRGKLTIDDTIWDILGEDRVAGSTVTVSGVDGMRLKVR